MVGRREVLEDFTPVGIFLGAAAMAFVHDYEVKKGGREFPVEAGAIGILRDGQVEK